MRVVTNFNELQSGVSAKPISQMSVFNASRFVSSCEYPTEDSLRVAFPLSAIRKMHNGWMVADSQNELDAFIDFYGKDFGSPKK
jgi:hypothetical protein